jgi:AcrR family transcriptional regulator
MELSNRQREIIDASIKLIARKGIQELTIKNLSGLVGISEPAIYRHFENKTDILAALIDYFGDLNDKVFKRIDVSCETSLKKLQSVFEHHFSNFTDNPAFSAVLFSEEIFRNDSDLSKKMFQMMQKAQTHVLGFIREGQASGEVRSDIPAEQLSFILIGSLRMQVTRWRLSGFSFDLVKEGEKLWEALMPLVKM